MSYSDRSPIPLRPDRSELARVETRAWRRAIAASALGRLHAGDSTKILKSNWPGDDRAAAILKSAVNPTSTADFPVHDITGTWRSLAPGSAGLQLLAHDRALKLDMAGIQSVALPRLAAQPQLPIFIPEGAPAPMAKIKTFLVGPSIV
jgi:hypothetical protein